MPFFSVIIPTYNRANMLAATLQTVVNQDFTDFEILVIDDGSTDNTPEMMQTLFANNTKVRYLPKKNEERSIARNYGLQHAKGKFAVFFDSDDFMHPDNLRTLYEGIEKNPTTNFFACKHLFDSNGKISYNDSKNIPEGFYDYKFLLEYGNVLGTLICVRIDNPALHLFPAQFNILEDWIFNMLNFRYDKIYLIDKFTMTVNNHENRTMQNNQKAIAARIAVTDYLLPKLELPDHELHIFRGKGYEFCAIHSYIDNNRKEALKYWKLTTKELGFSIKQFILLIKILIGKKFINLLQ
jgi:GalNAc5-diNAcBac-PP-undecaprenol beta-1,3-glucosyltransferase